MSEWKQKRFWKEASVGEVDGGFTILLDGRTVKTPAKAALVMPTRVMAEAAAAEWQAQEDEVLPLTMPVTRSANAAIDKVAIQHGEVADMLAAYGGTDLLCYRADSPQELIERIIAAAGTAPSGANKQPWRFVCVQDQAVKQRIRDLDMNAADRRAGGKVRPEASEYDDVDEDDDVGDD